MSGGDPAGNLVAFLRMPGRSRSRSGSPSTKATTAGGFGFSTAWWMKCGDDEGMKLGFASQPGVIVFAGGLPIRSGRTTDRRHWRIGASSQQDGTCAQAGLLAIGALKIEIDGANT